MTKNITLTITPDILNHLKMITQDGRNHHFTMSEEDFERLFQVKRSVESD